jgi:hypothetical protein
MTFGQVLFEALESLNSNKLRSGLTILGIVIGVAAVIAMLAVGQGAQNTILGSISGIGTNVLFVFRGNDQAEVRNARPLTEQDARRHDTRAPGGGGTMLREAPAVAGETLPPSQASPWLYEVRNYVRRAVHYR